jgi:hypothetical protein
MMALLSSFHTSTFGFLPESEEKEEREEREEREENEEKE